MTPHDTLDTAVVVLMGVVCVLCLMYLIREAFHEARAEWRYTRAWRDVEKRR